MVSTKFYSLHHSWDTVSNLTIGEVVRAVQSRIPRSFLIAWAVFFLVTQLKPLTEWCRRRGVSRKVHTFSWPLPKVRRRSTSSPLQLTL